MQSFSERKNSFNKQSESESSENSRNFIIKKNRSKFYEHDIISQKNYQIKKFDTLKRFDSKDNQFYNNNAHIKNLNHTKVKDWVNLRKIELISDENNEIEG